MTKSKKASDALWQLRLGILDQATLTLGDKRRVELSQTMIFMTSNLGGLDVRPDRFCSIHSNRSNARNCMFSCVAAVRAG